MSRITYHPIGVIRSPWKQPEGAPVQPPAAEGAAGTVEVHPEYRDALRDLDGFSHIILIYHCHLAAEAGLTAVPFLDTAPRGVFSIRTPSRPNPIGLSTVRLDGIDGTVLRIRDVDIVDGTPLLDIKPYVPAFDARKPARTGWLEGKAEELPGTKADGRFTE